LSKNDSTFLCHKVIIGWIFCPIHSLVENFTTFVFDLYVESSSGVHTFDNTNLELPIENFWEMVDALPGPYDWQLYFLFFSDGFEI
jgi:hypothetical protein